MCNFNLFISIISIALYLNKMWTKKENFEKRRKKRNQNPKLIILSLYKPNANEMVKKILYTSIFVQEAPSTNLTKFDMNSNSILAIMQNTSIWHIPYPFQNFIEKYFQNLQPRLWWAPTSHKLPIHALIIHFGNGELLKLI